MVSFDLSDKIALITGASRGLGAALAEAQEAERWLYTARHPGMVRWAIAFQALASACANDTAAARSSLAQHEAFTR